MAKSKEKQFYTLKEISVMLEVSHQTVMKHARDGLIETVVIGKKTKRVSKEALQKYINKNN